MTQDELLVPLREPDFIMGVFYFWFDEMIAEQRKQFSGSHYRTYKLIEEDGYIVCAYWHTQHTLGELSRHVQEAWNFWKCNKIAEEVLLGSND